jgi:carbamoyltransferase
VAAVEEERYTRHKYEMGFPHRSIRYCLDVGNLRPTDIDHIAVSADPLANFWPKVRFAVGTKAGRRMTPTRGDRLALMRVKHTLAHGFGLPARDLPATVHRVEHHLAHIGSAFYVSPFERAAVLSLDGFGDMVSAMWGSGRGARLNIEGEVNFPHSLGIYYLGFTQYLGFHKYGDEYKVMGLSAYGEPEYIDQMRDVLRQGGHGLHFELDMSCFRHLEEMDLVGWRGGTAIPATVWGRGMAARFGAPRLGPGDPLDDRHRNVAASMQLRLEEVVLSMLRELRQRTGLDALCLAGGVALNCVANGRIRAETGFREIFIQPAAYDGGTSVGAAYFVQHQVLVRPRAYVMDHVYLGPEFDEAACRNALEGRGVMFQRLPDPELFERTAAALDTGRIVGWFQGRMEFGPRALGNRSILADPRRPDMKDVLNSRVKHREPFRPFAPSILQEATADYFEDDYPSPFMLMAYGVKSDKRQSIPAPTHVDGTGRLQTVREEQNPRYHALLTAFGDRTGVPVLLNTSFNENEPICCTPEEAVDTFCRTRIDALVLGNLYAEKETPSS